MKSRTVTLRILAAIVVQMIAASVAATPVSPFAKTIIKYWPAPGYFVNSLSIGDPAQVLGRPQSTGTHTASTEVVSLGAFGGSVTLAFEHTVKDDPNNPMGMDAIVFGNGLWPGSSSRRFQEPGIIEISRDSNGNGLADDPWYVIPGSHLASPLTPVSMQYHKTSGLYPPEYKEDYPNRFSANGLLWYPQYPDSVLLSAYLLPASLAFNYLNPNTNGVESVWGYADCSPALKLGDMNVDNLIDDAGISPEEFYSTPDDPLAVGITPGSGGGDAFDIAWAVGPGGTPANLDGFDFIRITTGVDAYDIELYDASTEVDAVADVSPAPGPVRALKEYPDGTGARLSQAVVTAAFAGEFYVRDAVHSGIKVRSSISVSPGDLVNVMGAISTAGGERYICTLPRNGAPREAFVRVVGNAPATPKPLGMMCSLVGGKDLTAHTPGVKNGSGLNNIGSLVRIWGRVVEAGTDYLRITDGSMSESQTLKVYPIAQPLDNPEYVVVTGISACEQSGNDILRMVRPLQNGGVVKMK